MARKGLTAVWRDALRDSDLDSVAKLVGHTLCTYANGRGHAYPGRAALAAGGSVSIRSAERAIARLERGGWLAVARATGRGRTNNYVLLLPETASDVRRLEWERATETPEKGEPLSSKGEPGTPESALKALESRDADDAAPDGASPAPLDECSTCGHVRALVDDRALFCADCAPKAATA